MYDCIPIIKVKHDIKQGINKILTFDVATTLISFYSMKLATHTNQKMHTCNNYNSKLVKQYHMQKGIS